jgi:hypothetical protein
MLRNIPINELIKVLTALQKESSLCTIEIDEGRKVITFFAVRNPDAIRASAKIETPQDLNIRIDIDDLDKLIV